MCCVPWAPRAQYSAHMHLTLSIYHVISNVRPVSMAAAEVCVV